MHNQKNISSKNIVQKSIQKNIVDLTQKEVDFIAAGACQQAYYCDTIIGMNGRPELRCGVKLVCSKSK